MLSNFTVKNLPGLNSLLFLAAFSKPSGELYKHVVWILISRALESLKMAVCGSRWCATKSAYLKNQLCQSRIPVQ